MEQIAESDGGGKAIGGSAFTGIHYLSLLQGFKIAPHVTAGEFALRNIVNNVGESEMQAEVRCLCDSHEGLVNL